MQIGYYAHHHGSGHCRQVDKLVALLPADLQKQITVFTSLAEDAYRFTTIAEAQIVRLSAEDELPEDVLAGRAGQYWQPASLHYSPVGNKNIQTRSWQILNTIQQRQIDLMIIDVSAEVAMLCRAASVPYLYVRLPGERDDLPHLSAFAGALGLLVPYPKALEAVITPDWVRQKSLYLGFLPDKSHISLSLSDFIKQLNSLRTTEKAIQHLDNEQAINDKACNKPLPPIVTVIKGYGGHEAIDAKLPILRQTLPQAFIISLGPINDKMRQYVDMATEVNDVTPFIAHSDWLLMACGLNAIAQAYNFATPLVVLPDDRPHREQEVMAEALIAQGRALSWEQFITQMTDKDNINNNSVNNDDAAKLLQTLPNNQEFTDNPSNSAAQNFMDSLVNYDSVKPWFKEWLLLQLGITFEV